MLKTAHKTMNYKTQIDNAVRECINDINAFLAKKQSINELFNSTWYQFMATNQHFHQTTFWYRLNEIKLNVRAIDIVELKHNYSPIILKNAKSGINVNMANFANHTKTIISAEQKAEILKKKYKTKE